MSSPVRNQTIGDVRAPWLWPATIGLALVVATSILFLTSYKNFFYDEWDFITCGREWNASVFFQPHNEHWSTLPILVWKVLFVTFGIRSHIPFEAALLAVHVAAVLLLFALIRRHSGDLPAFGGALILLVFGAGGTNIVWAFQIGFVGSVAFGLLAIVIVEGGPARPIRMIAASAALLGSLMCSGVGLAFLGAAAALVLLKSQNRSFWPVLVLPTFGFVAWFLSYGARLPGTPGAHPTCIPTGYKPVAQTGDVSFGYAYTLAVFVWSGLKATVGAVFSTPDASPILFLLVLALFAFHIYVDRRVEIWQVALAVGLLSWFVLIGVGRSQRGLSAATDPHYLYVGAVFLLPLLADATKGLLWRGLGRPILAGALGLLVLANSTQLLDMALGQGDLMQTENAELQTTLAFRGAPDMELNRTLDDTIMPQLNAADLFVAADKLGSPVRVIAPSMLGNLQAQAVDREMLNLFGGAISVVQDRSRSTQGMACQVIDSAAGSNLDFQLRSSESVMVQSSKDGDAYLYVAAFGRYPSLPVRRMPITAQTPEWVRLPDTGSTVPWQLRIQTLDLGSVVVCSSTTPRVSRTTTFRADVHAFVLGPGWSVVPDRGASLGRALRAAAGTPGPQGAYSDGFIPTPGSYDVWYHVRVANTSGATGEIVLGLVDVDAAQYAASQILRANDASTAYGWLQVASDLPLKQGHVVKFQTNIANRLTTDWYVDQAVMVAAGSPTP